MRLGLLSWLLWLPSFCLAGGNSFLGPNGLPQTSEDGCSQAANLEDRENTIGVLMTRRSKGLCTGTLISPHVVLTAAHCVVKEGPDDVAFSLAADPNVSGTRFAAARRLLPHPEFSKLRGPRDQHVDLALVELESTDYGPMPKVFYSVGGADDEVFGTTARIVGYGTDKYGTLGFRRSKTVTLDRANPRNHMLRLGDGPEGSRPCAGDSGSPVLKLSRGRMRVLAVFSWTAENLVPLAVVGGIGTPGGTQSYLCRTAEGQYASWVDSYADWIDTNRRAMETDPKFKICP